MSGTERFQVISLKDDGPRRKHARWGVVDTKTGETERTFSGAYAAADARNLAVKMNRADEANDYCDCPLNDPREDGLCGYCLREVRV